MNDWREWLCQVRRMLDASIECRHAHGVTIQRVAGGNNNALYRIQADGQTCACKLCVADERHRAAREYAALSALQAAGLDIAPEPLWLDESCELVPYPAIAYRWLDGQPLDPLISDEQLDAVLASVQLMHTLEPGQHGEMPDTWFHWFDFSRYLPELDEFVDQYGPWLAAHDLDGRELQERLAQLLDSLKRLVAETRVNSGRAAIALRLCRADTSLANAIWGDDGRVRWVDWEYSGWGDPALELAEIRWHAAMTGLSQAQHDRLRRAYQRPRGDAGFDGRLAVWDRLVTTRWAFLLLRALWSAHNGPDRLRLSRTPADPAELRARLVRFIERAETLTQAEP
jgi:thiamine kinase-like enzyme